MFKKLKSLLSRRAPGRRGLAGPSSSRLEWYDAQSESGVRVGNQTPFEFSPSYAAISLISADVAKTRIQVFRTSSKGERKEDRRHIAHQLLARRPNSWQTPFTFKRQIVAELLAYGNAFVWVRRAPDFSPVELVPLKNENVRIESEREELGEFRYLVRFGGTTGGEEVTIEQDSMLHFRGLACGVEGYSVATQARQSLGLGLAAQRYTNKFFNDQSYSNLMISWPGELSEQAADEARRMISERHSGVSKGGWKPWVLQNGGEVKNVTTSNEQGCLPEVLAHSIRDTANWFGVPPHRIGDTTRTSFSSLEEEQRSYFDSAIFPIFENLQQEFEAKIFTTEQLRRGALEVAFDKSKLRAANTNDRSEHWSKMVGLGILSRDEVRSELGLNSLPEFGDLHLRPMNLMAEGEEPTEPPEPTETEPTETEPPETEPPETEPRAVVRADREAWSGMASAIAEPIAKRMEAEASRGADYAELTRTNTRAARPKIRALLALIDQSIPKRARAVERIAGHVISVAAAPDLDGAELRAKAIHKELMELYDG